MNHAHFQRFGRSTFVCYVCNRRTRDAGQPDCGLCLECYELAGLDNHVNDNGPERLADVIRERNKLFTKAVRLGGDALRIRASNRFLFPENLTLPQE